MSVRGKRDYLRLCFDFKVVGKWWKDVVRPSDRLVSDVDWCELISGDVQILIDPEKQARILPAPEVEMPIE